MLRKLYLYDLRALRRTVLPFLICSPILALFSFALTQLNMLLEIKNTVLFVTLFLLQFICNLGVFLLYVAIFFFVVFRYYKNLFTDEGYLTLVLPATIKAQVTAKILSGVTVTAIASLVLSVSFFLSVGLPLLLSEEATYLFTSILSLLNELGFTLGGLNGILALVSALTSLFAQIILIYTAITLGSLLMRRHKIFGSVLFYFLINLVVSTVNSLFSGGLDLLLFLNTEGAFDLALAATLSYSAGIVLNAALIFGGFFSICSMMEKRLNLE